MSAGYAGVRRRGRTVIELLRDVVGRWRARRLHLRQLERIFG